MRSRVDVVVKALSSTFGWVFDDRDNEALDSKAEPSWERIRERVQSFVHWLFSGTGAYHIAGKLGSGKSDEIPLWPQPCSRRAAKMGRHVHVLVTASSPVVMALTSPRNLQAGNRKFLLLKKWVSFATISPWTVLDLVARCARRMPGSYREDPPGSGGQHYLFTRLRTKGYHIQKRSCLVRFLPPPVSRLVQEQQVLFLHRPIRRA